MKYFLSVFLGLLSFSATADNEDSVNVLKGLLKATLKGDFKVLEESYAESVVVVAGHKFLHFGSGIGTGFNVSVNTEVTREKMIDAHKAEWKKYGGVEIIPDSKRDPFEGLPLWGADDQTFEVFPAKPGDLALEPNYRVTTEDKLIHFTIKEGDLMIKVTSPRGIFGFFQMRKFDGKWQVIAEQDP